jgi:2-methylcitrate dehydratase
MENVLFKISFPAEFHAQTAVEAALKLHEEVAERLDAIERITIETQEAGVRIIDKTGPLANPADRDHCLQYMVAVPLIFGRLTADDYEDGVALDPRIDALRAKMVVTENRDFSRDYLDADKRAIGNAVQVSYKDGSRSERVAIDYPVGHRRRRAEGIPLLLAKFKDNLATRFGEAQIARIEAAWADQPRLERMPVDEFVGLWVSEP